MMSETQIGFGEIHYEQEMENIGRRKISTNQQEWPEPDRPLAGVCLKLMID